jgi:hypothetical protein
MIRLQGVNTTIVYSECEMFTSVPLCQFQKDKLQLFCSILLKSQKKKNEIFRIYSHRSLCARWQYTSKGDFFFRLQNKATYKFNHF